MKVSKDKKAILHAIKLLLKKRNLNYAHLANQLSVSEVTIKRFFIGKGVTIDRLSEIAQVLDISVFDLFNLASNKKEGRFELNLKQEHALATDIKLFIFFERLYKDRDPDKIIEFFNLSKSQFNQMLQKLEKLSILEIQENQNIKWNYSGSHCWLMNGPLQKTYLKKETHIFFQQLLQNDYVNNKSIYFTKSNRKLSQQNLYHFKRKLNDFFVQLRSAAYEDEILLDTEDLVEVGWVCGLTPFDRYKNFEKMLEQ